MRASLRRVGEDRDFGSVRPCRRFGGLTFARCSAAVTVPVGGEFQVNTYTSNGLAAFDHSVSIDADGDFVVVWHSDRTQER